MTKLLTTVEDHPGMFIFWCPECESAHFINAGWRFNGNEANPTVTPSVLVRAPMWKDDVKTDTVCHLYITAGQLQFLPDCTHALAGRTVDMEPFPE